MKTREENTATWKREVYKKYGTLFESQFNESSYAGFTPYGNYIINRSFPKQKDARILDIGCGIGGYIKVCIDRGYLNIEGIDISEESVTRAHASGLRQVKHGDVFEFLMKIDESTLDIVLCLDVIEHFERENAIRMLQEANRVLKPGGKIVLHVPNAEGVFGAKIRYADYTHEMAFTCMSVSQMLRYTGFDTIECFEDKPIVHGVFSAVRRALWTLMTLPFRLLHVVETGSFDVKLSQNIMAIGNKS